MTEKNLRDKILDAAVKILSESGIKKLAQPQVAKEANVRQSHLTYYFPKRSDLILAVAESGLSAIGKVVAKKLPEGLSKSTLESVHAITTGLLSDRSRTRMLLGLLVESEENPELQSRLQSITKKQTDLIALLASRKKNDPRVSLAHAALLGLGVHSLLHPDFTTSEMAEQVRELNAWLNESKPTRKKK